MERTTDSGRAASAPVRRVRRRAVGPPGATVAGTEPALGLDEQEAQVPDDDERLRSDRPPHHDQGV